MAKARRAWELAVEAYAPPRIRKRRGRDAGKKRDDPNKAVRFRCDFTSTQVKVMLARGWIQVVDPNDRSWDIWWCETSDVRQALDLKLNPRQKIPHFRNHYELTRKNYLWRNLKRHKKLLVKHGRTAPAEFCESMPITFELPNEYGMFVEEYRKRFGAIWIVKPVGGSQGRGIFLFRKLKDLVEWKSKQPSAQLPDTIPQAFLVQRYIDDPYLLSGRKFDLRIYVLVTSFHPLKVWLAREGFARLSGALFDLRNIDDSRVHLTNMAIQLKVDDRVDGAPPGEQVKQSYKWALIKLREYLTEQHGAEAVEALFKRIAGVIMASLIAVQPVMMQGKNSFELYGYDVLLDRKLKPWLLEVNASPALSGTDSNDYRLKFDLLDDVLNILDFEGRFSGRETRVGGFDLLWDDGPVWTDSQDIECTGDSRRRLNIFLGAPNDRAGQLRRLTSELQKQFNIF